MPGEHGGGKKESTMRNTAITSGTILALVLTAAPAVARDAETEGIDAVRAVTATYSWLPNALEEGFVPFSLEGTDVPTCFESDAGGMGVHYVRNIDGVADALDPEALVYELGDDGGLRLVGVEYIVPQEFVEDEDGNVVALPELHGQPFHKHATLPVYVLHAWVWSDNPDGMFADFDPTVAGCPAV